MIMKRPLEVKAVFVGSMAVGKTAISNYMQKKHFVNTHQATVGAGYFVHSTQVDGISVDLQLWDTAGMERYKSLGPIYYRGADAVIFVYDMTEKKTAQDIPMWYQNFTDSHPENFYSILVANKQDLVPEDESTEDMEVWASENGCDFIRTSAKSGTNITELLEKVVQGTLRSCQSVTVKTNSPKKQKQAKCC